MVKTIANILFYGGLFLGILGLLFIIRMDGSVKRVIACTIMVALGLTGVLVGNGMKNAQKVEYTVKEVIAVNTEATKYRVVLVAGGNSTVLYMDRENSQNFKEGETIEMSKNQIKEYQD